MAAVNPPKGTHSSENARRLQRSVLVTPRKALVVPSRVARVATSKGGLNTSSFFDPSSQSDIPWFLPLTLSSPHCPPWLSRRPLGNSSWSFGERGTAGQS